MALSCMPLTSEQKAELLGITEENLRHPSHAIQVASAAALRAFSRTYLTGLRLRHSIFLPSPAVAGVGRVDMKAPTAVKHNP